MNVTLGKDDLLHLLVGGTLVLPPNTKRIALADIGRATMDRVLDSVDCVIEEEGSRLGDEKILTNRTEE